MSDSSYIIPSSSHSPQPLSPSNSEPSHPSSPSEIDSLPSSPTTSTLQNTSDEEEEDAEEEGETDAEREWKESLQQLELLLTMVVVPYVGKYFGRKCAYWGEWMVLFLTGVNFWGRGEEGKTGYRRTGGEGLRS
ncbi:MAG: hypothetical protein Q9204_007294 [Flavoplaca sp. TL-2023a]